MIGKAITALVLAAALAGCSTFSDSKMTKMDQLVPQAGGNC